MRRRREPVLSLLLLMLLLQVLSLNALPLFVAASPVVAPESHTHHIHRLPPKLHVSPHIFALLVDTPSSVALELIFTSILALHFRESLRAFRPLVLSGPSMLLFLISCCISTAFTLSKLTYGDRDAGLMISVVAGGVVVTRLVLVSFVAACIFVVPLDRCDRETGVRGLDDYVRRGSIDLACVFLALAFLFGFAYGGVDSFSSFLIYFSAALKSSYHLVQLGVLWQFSQAPQTLVVLASRRMMNFYIPPLGRRTPSILLPSAYLVAASSSLAIFVHATVLNKNAVANGAEGSPSYDQFLLSVYLVSSIAALVGSILVYSGFSNELLRADESPGSVLDPEFSVLFPALGLIDAVAAAGGGRFVVEGIDDDDDFDDVDEILRDGLGLPAYAKDYTVPDAIPELPPAYGSRRDLHL